MGCLSNFDKLWQVLCSEFVLSEIEFEIGTHQLPSPNKNTVSNFVWKVAT